MLRTSAEQLVAQSLVLPLLEQMQHSPFRPKDGPFAMNTAEKRFAPLLYERLADQITQASNFDVVDAVVKRVGKGLTDEAGIPGSDEASPQATKRRRDVRPDA